MAIWTVDYAYLPDNAYEFWEKGQHTRADESPSCDVLENG